MNEMLAQSPTWVELSLEGLSAVFGAFAAYLMSRRYASGFLTGLVFALLAPVMFLLGRGEHVRRYYEARLSANRDVPLSEGQMVLGLNLLFWAFFLQLLGLLLA